MATCTKETEIEFSDDGQGECKVVDVTIEVEGYLDPDFGSDADGNRGEPTWFVDGWTAEYDKDGLTEKEILEINEKVEEIVLEESWDFEAAKDDADADDYEPEEL